ncbi:MFS transporter [Pseudalkalibacillus hwajinpoensis]|uniref:MFS transporter n=1 Tax=Guptibacillus hwajinpoensis TaxID=208199 RepID=UPI001CD41EC7|nr:MFS transporter [Pseudalkalibacillus hwajinpoensis]MCA0992108.1 MFS transporter [Pseudalkalibacillus hwajinpoensis]
MNRGKRNKHSQLIFLVSTGMANIGEWVYHIAINLIIFNQTGSALAVTGLYLLKPLATLLTNGWSGSVVDRVNKRKFMMLLLLFQAIILSVVPFFTSLWWIYCLVLIVNMGHALYHPASIIYMTKLVPIHERKQFNSFRSLMDSGAFVIGPAIAGLLFIISTPMTAIYVNALALVVAGWLITFLPSLEIANAPEAPTFTLTELRKDWRMVYEFSKKSRSVVIIYFLFSAVIVMTAGVDSLEAAFAKDVLNLTNSTYGFLVSIAGGGILLGAGINTFLVKRLTTSMLMGGGSFVLALGYFLFATASGMTMASVGCFILSFSLAFANTGFLTFYQEHIPVDVMGRIVSLFGVAEAIAIMFVTVTCGLLAELLSIRFSVVTGVLVMIGLSLLVCMYLLVPLKSWKAKRV